MKVLASISQERGRTGNILEQCKDCEYAFIADGEYVDGEILFCLKFFDFPEKFIRVTHIPSRVRYSFTERFWCER